MNSNRRKFKRLPIRGFMKCEVEFRHGKQGVTQVPVLSLSAGGMFIAVNEELDIAFKKGDLFDEIHFDIPELDRFHLKGEVVHRMSLGEIGGCGVQFFDTSQNDIDDLDDFVKGKLKSFGLLEFS